MNVSGINDWLWPNPIKSYGEVEPEGAARTGAGHIISTNMEISGPYSRVKEV